MIISKQTITNAYPQYQDNYFYEFSFGVDANLLGKLVLEQKKTATSSLQCLYQLENERIPQVGDIGIVLDGKNIPMCAIYNHKVEFRPFCEVNQNVAFQEGEGDLTLANWQSVHQHFFNKQLAAYSRTLKSTDIIVIEFFTVLNL